MAIIETNLAVTIAATEEDKARLDEYIKKLLSDKQILARILKYSLDEFKDYSIEEVIRRIGDDIEVATVSVEPGLTNLGRIRQTLTEESVQNEGTNMYDIRFTAKYGDDYITILINVEAQRSTKKSTLKYEIDNRIIFYIARMVSAQKQTEFFNSDYDSLKRVRGIWLCMDAMEDGDSINEIYMTQKCVFGKREEFKNLDLMKAVVIHIREKENVVESKNELIAMLEDLVSKETAESKKKKLADKYGMIMTQELEGKVNEMCNWSEAIEARGVKRGEMIGEAIGIDIGSVKKMVEIIIKKLKKDKTSKQIANELEEEIDNITPIIEVAQKYAPDYNIDSILRELIPQYVPNKL